MVVVVVVVGSLEGVILLGCVVRAGGGEGGGSDCLIKGRVVELKVAERFGLIGWFQFANKKTDGGGRDISEEIGN